MPPPGIIEPLIETVAVAVRPEGADRLPELLLVALGDREDAMRRASVVGFGRHGLVLSILSPPQWRPRCPSKAEAEKRHCQKRAEGPHKARSCTNAVRKRAALISNARRGRTGHKERTPCWQGQVSSKGR